MKKLLMTLLLVGIVLLMAAPVSAERPGPVGANISLYSETSGELPAMDFPENEAFWIAHGWAFHPANGRPIGLFSFELEIDGQPWEADFFFSGFHRGADRLLERVWLHNFPDGMTGTHTFTGRWFAPCKYADEYPGPCPKPMEVVEAHTTWRTVTFVPGE